MQKTPKTIGRAPVSPLKVDMTFDECMRAMVAAPPSKGQKKKAKPLKPVS